VKVWSFMHDAAFKLLLEAILSLLIKGPCVSGATQES